MNSGISYIVILLMSAFANLKLRGGLAVICNKEHRFLDDFARELRHSQKDTHGERHKCPGCAFVAGVRDALNDQGKRTELPDSIPDSQAGMVRHKDAWQAYELGYEHGLILDS